MAITNAPPGAKVPDACAQKFAVGSKAYLECKKATAGGTTPTQAPPGAQVPPINKGGRIPGGGGRKY